MDPLTLGMMGTMGAQAISGGIGAYANYKAQKQQLEANRRAQEAITQSYGKAQGYQQPYLSAGNVGLERMMNGNYDVNIPTYQQGEVPGPYQEQAFNYQEDPGMAYRMQTGTQAIQQGAAGQGTGLSGATLKALAKYGQDLGSQEYGNAYNRYAQNQQRGLAGYQTNLGRAQNLNLANWQGAKDVYGMGAEQATQRYGRASDLGQLGYGAATNMSNMATAYGGDLAGLYGAKGNIQAAGTMGMGQTIGNTIGNMANTGLSAYVGNRMYNSPYGPYQQSRTARLPYTDTMPEYLNSDIG